MEFVWTSTVYALIAFLILYFLLKKYAFGPLFGIMEKRREHIQEQIRSVEENRRETEKLLEEQRRVLADARKEARDIIEQARVTSAKQAEEIVQKAKEEAARLKDEALKQIENERKKAVAALREEVGELSVLIASKIIQQQMDRASQKQLVDEYLNEVGNRL